MKNKFIRYGAVNTESVIEHLLEKALDARDSLWEGAEEPKNMFIQIRSAHEFIQEVITMCTMLTEEKGPADEPAQS